ncbi:putative Calmodulin [Monocercomonoides exilis]|uniref:putative Calmodulin n=1 Tax=Monocercomonoides exilis TaxID=2049356 RepID=UPI003559E31C|nr:putative Calmodulin [Monocercomonoides exilis]|eukprot:MONOS_604.1-p1 / transcript=MONOS_604.1 / gene=MONOS_604 / organism=Monocercomonoides_exilis_PA203 / gene_product=Calmodulin / transcript_product=Calmodulin / location=Mono_scaffold00009:245216-245947(-) / protein_length=154 / sequence_SO=supercontig / SO=protein_coding / is_pseudo=false
MENEDKAEIAEIISEIRVAFSLFDTDGDGVILTKELRQIIRALGINPTEKEMNEMEHICDPKDEGAVTFPTVLEMLKPRLLYIKEEDLKQEIFEEFDKNEDGFINVTDLYQVMKELGEELTQEELQFMIQQAAGGKDVQKIDKNMFLKMVKDW